MELLKFSYFFLNCLHYLKYDDPTTTKKNRAGARADFAGSSDFVLLNRHPLFRNLHIPGSMPNRSTGHKFLATGIPEKSRSESYHAKGLWAIKAKHGGKFPAGKAAVPSKPRRVLVEKTVKVRRGPNKGKERKVQVMVPRVPRTFVNQPDAVRARHQRRSTRLPRLRRSIVPGRVCIVLEGKYRGKRVVVVKALQSGLVVVTGILLFYSFLLQEIFYFHF